MASGPEMLLRSLGLGEGMDQIKKLVDQGALEKILAFANNLQALQDKIDLQNDLLQALLRKANERNLEPCAGSQFCNDEREPVAIAFDNSTSQS
jgi:hypothetical protein